MASRQLNHLRHHSNWAQYYLAKWTGALQNGFTFHLRNGWRIAVPRRMLHTYKEIFFDDTYLSGFPAEVVACKFQTIVDVGANVGYFSLSMAARFPDANILACEPMPNNQQLLHQYLEDLPGHHITAVNQAIAGENGQLLLHFDRSDAFTTSATVGAGQPDTLEVASMTLERLMETHQFQHIDLLKLDCEGAEYDILLNLQEDTFPNIRMIAMEHHADPAGIHQPQDLIDLIASMGFSIQTRGSKVWAWR